MPMHQVGLTISGTVSMPLQVFCNQFPVFHQQPDKGLFWKGKIKAIVRTLRSDDATGWLEPSLELKFAWDWK